jgi:hypothetical protein
MSQRFVRNIFQYTGLRFVTTDTQRSWERNTAKGEEGKHMSITMESKKGSWGMF